MPQGKIKSDSMFHEFEADNKSIEIVFFFREFDFDL